MTAPDLGLPADMEFDERDLSDLCDYLASLGLRYFRPHEFLIHCDAAKNTLPPRELWGNIALTAKIIDEARYRLGQPVRITSCYRSPEYNAQVGGARKSQHKLFRAVDLVTPAGAQSLYDALLKMRRDHLYSGGLGFYVNRFVHVDTRGYNATWRG